MSVEPVVFKVSRRDDGGFAVTLRCADGEPVHGDFAVDLARGSRLSRTIERVHDNKADKDDLADVGSQLWAGLLAGDVNDRFRAYLEELPEHDRRFLQLRLDLPPILRPLPWETLYDDRLRFLASRRDHAIVRELSDAGPGPSRTRDKGPLKILVAVPEDSGLQVGHEWRNLQFLARKLGESIEIDRIDGPVTPNLVEKHVGNFEPDVFLFVGHGRVEGKDDVRIRLNRSEADSDRSLWVDADAFASLFSGSAVQLAVLNCCLGATPSSSLSLAGVGPYLAVEGVRAVVAMRYEIADDDAIRFSTSFFRSLLSDDYLGRVDVAATQARRELFLNRGQDNVRSFVTPVLYLAPGFQQLDGLKASAGTSSGTFSTLGGEAPPGLKLPEGLIAAVRERRCVPLIGPRALAAGATRNDVVTPGPRTLARRIADECDYPNTHEFEAAERAEELLSEHLLARVCEHFMFANPGQGYKLPRLIKDAFETATPPPTFQQMAFWEVPGFVYSYIDGQLHEALKDVGRPPRVINKVDEAGDVEESQGLLVHLRGTIDDIESLVLTEQDHEQLWDRMAALNAQVVNLVHDIEGCSLLMLGVNPTDRVVRRFVTQLLSEAARLLRGPVYFVQPPGAGSDSAYWEHLDVNWIEADTESFVSAMSAAMSEPSS